MRYIEYLEAAFLIRRVRRVDDRARHFQRARNFKVYLTNPSLRTALFGGVGADESSFGSLVETAVFAQLFHAQLNLYYARWKQGELDIVSMRAEQVNMAVEVKWSDRAVRHPAILREAVSFCVRNNVRRLIVTTRTVTTNTTIDNVEVNYWPSSLYTYALGHSIINSRILALENVTAAT
jgi:predicted AAA+ superfamily ATPase